MSMTAETTIRFDELIDRRTKYLMRAAEGPGLLRTFDPSSTEHKVFGYESRDDMVQAMMEVRQYLLARLPIDEVKAAFYALNLSNPNAETEMIGRLYEFLEREERLRFLWNGSTLRDLAYKGMRTIALCFDAALEASALRKQLDVTS